LNKFINKLNYVGNIKMKKLVYAKLYTI